MSALPKDTEKHWASIQPLLAIRTDREYQRAVKRLNALLDEIGSDERHPLYELLDTLGTVVHAYEDRHVPLPASTGAGMLQFMLEEHGLTQAELPEVGSQGVVSEVLHGKRELNVRQIRALAKRFHVSPAVFI